MFEQEPKVMLSQSAWLQIMKELEDNLKTIHGWEDKNEEDNSRDCA